MSPRTHLCLRIGAIVLLMGAAIWPRSRGVLSADELTRTNRAATVHARAATTHMRTASAKLISAPGSAKLVVATAEDSDLTN